MVSMIRIKTDRIDSRLAGSHALKRLAMVCLCVTVLFGAGLSMKTIAAEAGERELSLTVYNRDLAVVRDVRTLPVVAGVDWLTFTDVPERIDPTSVHLKAIGEGEFEVLEQNYVYDLINPDKVMDRYIDHVIRVTAEDGRLFEGTLLSHMGGRVVLRGENDAGNLSILSLDKISDFEFPSLPAGLITRPALEWLLSAEKSREQEIEVSYMTGGLNWHAEYVAVVDANDSAMGLSGWVSLDNRSGATYEDAELQLVAGEPQILSRQPEARGRGGMKMMAMDATNAAPGFEEESFFEYHLYTLGRKTTLKQNETKQVSLFSPAECDVKKLYETNPVRDNNKVRVVLEAINGLDEGLGMPLPAGKVRVYKRDSRERLQFIGEDKIDHTPRDEKVRILLGNAFDLVAERTELDSRKLGSRTRELDVKIELRNRKDSEKVEIVVQEDLSTNWQIKQSSETYEKINSRRVEFRVPVAAGEVKTITYTVRYSW
jgi:hypothetical protein